MQDRPDWAYDWSKPDAAIDRATAAGQQILVLIAYAPPWSNGHDATHDDKWLPLPEYDSGWAAFVDAMTRRYAGRVQVYEIWNEPNDLHFGNYGSNTDEERRQRYWDLVRLSHTTITSACGSCLVVAGGPEGGNPPVASGQPNPNSPAAWLDWAYRHGCGDDFDAVATHPYPIGTRKECPVPADNYCGRPSLVLFGADYLAGRPYQQQCGQLGALRAVLVDNGDADKKIWGTEWGYPTASYLGAAHPSLDSIRDFDVEGVHLWRERPYLGPLFLYQHQDGCADPVDSECHYGTVDRNAPATWSDTTATATRSGPATRSCRGQADCNRPATG
ncbi:hypothetical protein [Actinoplanes sp. NPDC026619]|uniref:hypothetical protein n=1 Tax=Actinoplanes sp. NPDC026619 TaxID=3155798 RepID=UPI0033E3FF31